MTEMPDDDLVAAVRRAAAEILDDPDRAVDDWLAERVNLPRAGRLPDQAPMHGLGGPVVLELVALARQAWAYGMDALAHHGPTIADSALARLIAEGVTSLLKTGINRFRKRGDPPLPAFSLSPEEAGRVVPVIVAAVVAALPHAGSTMADDEVARIVAAVMAALRHGGE